MRTDTFFVSENGQYQCFYQDPMHWGKGRLLEEAAESGPKIEAKGRDRGGVLREWAASPTS